MEPIDQILDKTQDNNLAIVLYLREQIKLYSYEILRLELESNEKELKIIEYKKVIESQIINIQNYQNDVDKILDRIDKLVQENATLRDKINNLENPGFKFNPI